MKAAATIALLVFASAAGAQSCRVDVVPLVFGVYDPASAAPTDARADLALVCTADANARAIDGVAVRIGGDVVRTLAGSGGGLRYQLFRDAAATRPWHGADAASVALPPAADGRASDVRVPVYGRIAPGQWIAPGAYVDSVEVVVEF